MIKKVELICRTVFGSRLLFQGRTFFGGVLVEWIFIAWRLAYVLTLLYYA
jgi:hypothetical protein